MVPCSVCSKLEESLALVAPQVERAVTLFPSVCVAAFYVEHDDSMGLCHSKFSRLEEISKSLKRGGCN